MPRVFKNPPINEVVIASYFTPEVAALRSEHIGLFWDRIKHEFPVVRQQPPVGPPVGPPISADEPFPMPRYWFVANDDVYLIQVQKNAFILNWRYRGSNEYPRFHKDIKPTFDKYHQLFDEFVRTEIDPPSLSIDLCELTYINTIEQCEFWKGPQDTSNVIPEFSAISPNTKASNLLGFNCQYAYRIEANLELFVVIRNGVVPQKTNVPTLIIEIKGGGRLGQATKAMADKWFDQAHDAIIDCFENMTNPAIQDKYWKPVEEVQ